MRLHSLFYMGVLTALTWRRAAVWWNLQKPAIRTPFTTVLLRNGTLYFLVIGAALLLNAAGMILLLNEDQEQLHFHPWLEALASAGPVVDAITSICMSRFILDLLSLARVDDVSPLYSWERKTNRLTTMVEAVAGGMGADMSDNTREEVEEMVGEEERYLERVCNSVIVVTVDAIRRQLAWIPEVIQAQAASWRH